MMNNKTRNEEMLLNNITLVLYQYNLPVEHVFLAEEILNIIAKKNKYHNLIDAASGECLELIKSIISEYPVRVRSIKFASDGLEWNGTHYKYYSEEIMINEFMPIDDLKKIKNNGSDPIFCQPFQASEQNIKNAYRDKQNANINITINYCPSGYDEDLIGLARLLKEFGY